MLDLEFFVEALAKERKSVRDHAAFVYAIFSRECPRLLADQKRLPDKAFTQRANTLYAYADSQSRLDAIRVVYTALYEYHLKAHPDLVAPKHFFPITSQRPVVHEGAPTFSSCASIHDAIMDALSLRSNPKLRFIALSLMLAHHAEISSVKALENLLAKTPDDITLFPNAAFGTVLVSNRRIILDALAIACIRQIAALPSRSRSTKQLSSHYKKWVRELTLRQPDLCLPDSLGKALDALTYTTQSVAMRSFNDLYTPLSEASFIRAVSGNNRPDEVVKDTVTPTRRPRKSVREFLGFEQLATLFAEQQNRPLAYRPENASADTRFFDDVRRALKDLITTGPTESRKNRRFDAPRKRALAIIEAVHADAAECSLIAALIGTYAVDLALHGSNTKSQLAISSIETYLSTLSSFATSAWSDEALLRESQYSGDALDEQTEMIADTLSDLYASDQQSTVLNFLQYLRQSTRLKVCDFETLEYLGAGVADTRAHYVTPHDFDAACEQFLSDVHSRERMQCILFAQLAYHCGLRRREAALLRLSDIRFDLGTLYVSRLIRRKSHRAYRRIPISLLPMNLRSQLNHYIHERKTLGCESVFDNHALEHGLDELMKILRMQCSCDDLVIHSLRHSAVNNVLWRFYLLNTEHTASLRKKLYFLSADIFNTEHQNGLRKSLAELGRTPSIYTPWLDIVAQIAGHVSPSVTAQSYLHLLDSVFFYANHTRRHAPNEHLITALLPPGKYQFEWRKKYQRILSDREDIDAFLFQTFTRGLSKSKRYSLQNSSTKPLPSKHQLSLSEYLHALKIYKEHPSHQSKDDALIIHFSKCSSGLSLDFYQTAMRAKNVPSWARLIERLSIVDWNKKNSNAVITLNRVIHIDQITNLRDARQYLRALRLMGITNATLQIALPESQHEMTWRWLDAIEKSGFSVEPKKSDKQSHPALFVRPYALRWPMWPMLPSFLPVLLSYIHYINGD